EGEPPAEELHARRGRAAALCGRPEQAVADLTKALGPRDFRAELWYFRGLARAALNQNDKAGGGFSEAINGGEGRGHLERPTGDAWVIWFQRGQVYFRLGQRDRAIADLSQVLTMNPDHGPSWYGRGQAHAEAGDLERAAADFAAAVQRPDSPALAWCDLAQA